ncbi:MAG: hypothetical protein JXR95_03735 [Deltaproteobacteria bacterium]|nr:hypothetical protein [Deltaproteobacteria bacterium]
MKKIRFYLPFVFLFSVSISMSCSGGGCSEIEPLDSPLPPNQIIENGVQLRITQSGFDTIKTILPQYVEGEFGHIAFIPNFWVGDSGHSYGIDFCPLGCGIELPNIDLDFSLVDNTENSNNIDQCKDGVMSSSVCDEIYGDIQANLYFGFDIDIIVAGSNISDQCSIDVGFVDDPFSGSVALGLRTRPEDGYLRMDINSVSNLDLSGLEASLNNCIPFVDGIINALVLENIGQYIEILDAFVGDAIVNWIANNLVIPLLQPTIDKLIPDIGLEGQINAGSFLASAGFSGVDANLEMKMISGGYVDVKNHGITAGIITGFNSDRNPDTRGETKNEFSVAEHSEGARCIPPIATPDLTQTGLSVVSGVSGASADRMKTFTRAIIEEYSGMYDQAALVFENGDMADVSVAITQDMLNLAGFHIVNSGALCLTMGTEDNELVKVGTFSVLIPSMAEIIDPKAGDAPLQLVIRPQNALQFQVGQGTGGASGLIDLYLQDFQIDLYPFVNGRYARALTLALDMHLQMDLEEGVDEEGNVTVMPVLRPVDESLIGARVLNSDLIREDPAEVAAIFPSILGMIMPMLTGALQPIPMPNFEITKLNANGDYLTWKIVQLDNLEFKSSTAQDAILINAKIISKSVGTKKMDMDPFLFDAQLTDAVTYSPERLRATLMGTDNARPYIIVSLDGNDGEYQYRIDRGLWSPFIRTDTLEIEDLGLFLQGKHTVEIRGRRAGDPRSLNLEVVTLPFVLDTVAPTLTVESSEGEITLNGHDFVSSSSDLKYSILEGKTWSEWSSFNIIDGDYASRYSSAGILKVRVKDEMDNVSTHEVFVTSRTLIFEDTTSMFGCSSSGKGASDTGISLFLILGMVFAGFKLRRKLILPLGILAIAAFITTGCADNKKSVDNNTNPSCSIDDDCAGISCPDDEISLCIGGFCDCVNDIPWGIPGPHSSVTVIGQYAWVSSYNLTYGDLMIAKALPSDTDPAIIRPDDWSFIDGVPAGPVVLPTSDVRWGISAAGEDVGEYTSIGELTVGQPIIAHRNTTTGSLRITYTTDGTNFTSYDLDDGGDPTGTDFGSAGFFNHLTIRASDKAPSVAYMVNNIPNVSGTGLTSELRFAQANVPLPQSPSDWTFFTVDSVDYPFPDIDAVVDDWPQGTGLFVSHTRFDDGRVAISWYDQYEETLKFSYQEVSGGDFVEPMVVTANDDTVLPRGLFASHAIDDDDQNMVHFVYQDSMQKSLYFASLNLSTSEVQEELIDDGFREDDGDNNSGLPMPVQHYFGADAAIESAGSKVFLIWQDATNQELYIGVYDFSENDPIWDISILRGGEEPYEGSFGFYIDTELKGPRLYISNYAVNLHAEQDILGNPALRYFVEVYTVSSGIVE